MDEVDFNLVSTNCEGNNESLIDNEPLISNEIEPKFQSKNVFNEGDYRIDFVLVYDQYSDKEIRNYYESNLEKKGLLLEKTDHEKSTFVKIHAPNNVLKRYCEILKIRMPVKVDDTVRENQEVAKAKNPPICKGCCSQFKLLVGHIINFFGFDTTWIPRKDYKITAEYSQNKAYIFDDDSPSFFSTSDRCMIVNFILEQTKFRDKLPNAGISKLLDLEVYSHAYPPHEGTTNDPSQNRGRLMQSWASIKNIFSYQPIDEIKDYFGMKFALYFAWSGFYTYMLLPASILGVLSVLYGVFTQDKNFVGKEICEDSDDILMCPSCDKFCELNKIKDACVYYKIRYLFDNNATYVFAFLMSVWSALYLKLWKRYSAEITHRWGLTGFSLIEEHPRPNYDPYTCTKKSQDPSKIRYWTIKFPSRIFSYTLVLFWIMVALGFVFAVILYSMYMQTCSFLYEKSTYQEKFFIPVSSAILNYIFINILNAFYSRAAFWLTELEFRRTQVQFDDSLQLKIFLFQFMNYFTPIFYVAFLKGRFVGTPYKYHRIWGMRQEECDLGGCLFEVCIQLATFMICDQLFNNFIEYIWPLLITFQRSWKDRGSSLSKMFKDLLRGICGNLKEGDEPRWMADITLNSWDAELSDEYLEMVIQFGFVTLFVTAFPLAPLLALFNNVFIEKHLDAKKFICNYRRPVAQRVPDIGIWFYIMRIISKISILTNACIMASTSNLIPMLSYRFDNNGEIKGFLNHSLGYIEISKLDKDSRPLNPPLNVTICRFNEFRDENFERTFEYWHILVARLAFIVIYQNLVSYFVTIIEWIIPDVPKKLKVSIKKQDKHLSDHLLNAYEEFKRKSTVHRRSNLSTNIVNDENIV